LVAHDIGFEKMKELYDNKEIGKNENENNKQNLNKNKSNQKYFLKLLKFLIKIITLNKYGTTELDYHKWAMRHGIKEANHIITVSEFSKKEISDFYNINSKNITAIHNGFASDVYRPILGSGGEAFENILSKYKIKTPFILFIGRLEAKKNVPNLILAYEKLKKQYNIPHKLVLIGTPGYKYEDIEANIYKSKLKDHIIEPGYVAGDDINIIMNLADIFVLPSLYEGFGIPILEAQSAGTPVSASNIEAIKEVGGDACHYFDPNNLDNMAKQMFTLISDNDLKQKYIKSGFNNIKRFSWTKCANQTWEVLKKYGK
ncbi:MAG: glycosyltransferase family 1 protein, partial [Patescibacteria group bacterium]